MQRSLRQGDDKFELGEGLALASFLRAATTYLGKQLRERGRGEGGGKKGEGRKEGRGQREGRGKGRRKEGKGREGKGKKRGREEWKEWGGREKGLFWLSLRIQSLVVGKVAGA